MVYANVCVTVMRLTHGFLTHRIALRGAAHRRVQIQRATQRTSTPPTALALPTNSHASSRVILNDRDRTLRTGFRPSRLRHLPSILNTTADGAQRSGDSLPSFLPRGSTPSQALELARNIDPFGRALDIALSNRDRGNYWRVTHEPKVVKAGRRKVLRGLARLAAAPKPLQDRLKGAIDTSPAREAFTHTAYPFRREEAQLP